MIATRRRTFQIGGSRGVTLPGGREIGEEVSMAVNRLLLMDTTGEIPEAKLLEFLKDELEPAFWRWWEPQKKPKTTVGRGAFKPQEVEVKPLQATPSSVAVSPGFYPGPLVYEVTCPRCKRKFGWDIAGYGKNLYCFYCGMPIELTI